MSAAPWLALLGVALLSFSGSQALKCQWGTYEAVQNVLQLPLTWTSGRATCVPGAGCQDTAILIVNGPQVNLVLSKGCTRAEDHEARVIQHRAGPGLAVISYTHVCRHGDYCNDLSTSALLWSPPPSTVPGTVRCPVCLSKQDCPETAPQQMCPVGHSHCYSGVLRLHGAGIISKLRVQGCMPEPGCHLLNGTKEIGPVSVSEDCSSKADEQRLDCQWGTYEVVQNVSQLPLTWTSGWATCVPGAGCQDTAILIVNGPQVNLVLSKGCTRAEDHEARVIQHRAGPGLAVISYTHVCRHGDYCNDLSTSALLWSPPPSTVPGTVRCPVCLSKQDCPETAPQQMCPVGHSHCYSGVLRLHGAGIISKLRVQGCMPEPGCHLLNGTKEIGPVSVSEDCSSKADTLICHRGTMLVQSNSHEEPQEWTTRWSESCNSGQMCQETLLLIDAGHRILLVGSKGCAPEGAQETQAVSLHAGHPGVLVASYVHFCASDLCNQAQSSSVLLDDLPPPAAPEPGGVQCPSCVDMFGSCSESSRLITCPQGTMGCYDGSLALNGGGVSATVNIQSCLTSSFSSFVNDNQNLGIFSVAEIPKDSETDSAPGARSLSGAAPVPPWWG